MKHKTNTAHQPLYGSQPTHTPPNTRGNVEKQIRLTNLRRSRRGGNARHPFRTRKLSPTAPMVLHLGGCGRVGHRRNTTTHGPLKHTRLRGPNNTHKHHTQQTRTISTHANKHTKTDTATTHAQTKQHHPKATKPLSHRPCLHRMSLSIPNRERMTNATPNEGR